MKPSRMRLSACTYAAFIHNGLPSSLTAPVSARVLLSKALWLITLKPAASIYALSFVEGGAGFYEFQKYNPFELKRSAGLGIRIFMPAFGLLGIDFGYGFDRIPGDTQISGWQTHFIIGQQF